MISERGMSHSRCKVSALLLGRIVISKAINASNPIALFQQTLNEVRADKSGTSRYRYLQHIIASALKKMGSVLHARRFLPTARLHAPSGR